MRPRDREERPGELPGREELLAYCSYNDPDGAGAGDDDAGAGDDPATSRTVAQGAPPDAMMLSRLSKSNLTHLACFVRYPNLFQSFSLATVLALYASVKFVSFCFETGLIRKRDL